MHGIIYNNSDRRSVGSHRIAHSLRNQGFSIEVVDFFGDWSLKQLKRFFRKEKRQDTKFIGISNLFHHTFNADQEAFMRWIRLTYPEIYIICGSQSLPKFPNKYIDYYIHGYGEAGLKRLLGWLFSNGKKPTLYYHNAGHRWIDNQNLLLANNDYPSVPQKMPLVYYTERDYLEPWEPVGIEFSRGCKFKCSFCNFPFLGVKEDYTRSTEGLELQLKHTYDNFGVSRYYVSDETFNDSVAKIRKYADLIQTLDFQPEFTGFIRPDLMISRKHDKEELLRMGFIGHFYGIETFNQKTGKAVGKGMDPEKMKDGLLDAKEYFTKNGSGRYKGTTSFIVGLPYEDFNSLDNTKKWLKENWQDQAVTQWALEIPIKGSGSNSTITRDYTSFGYKEINIRNEGTDDIENATFEARERTMPWKNEFMDVYKAAKYSVNWQKEIHKAHTLDNWDIFLDFDNPKFKKDILTMTEPQADKCIERFQKKWVDAYIQKKLNQ